MKIYRYIIFCLIAVFLSFTLSKVQAAIISPTPIDYHLPYPGLIPDHPLYRIKKIRDWLLVNLTRNELRKIELHLIFADKKLVMGDVLFKKRNTKLSIETFFEAETELSSAVSQLSLYSESQIPPTGLADKLELSVQKHEEVINSVLSEVTDLQQLDKLKQSLSINHKAYSQIQLIKK